MISSLTIRTVVLSALCLPIAMHSVQPIDLNDHWTTFSSKLSNPATPVAIKSSPRQFAPYACYYLVGTAMGFLYSLPAIALAQPAQNKNLPWWERDDHLNAIVYFCMRTGGIIGLWMRYTKELREKKWAKEVREQAQEQVPLDAQLFKIVGETSFLDAIKTDNAEHMQAWIEHDNQLIHENLRTKSIQTWQDSKGRDPIMLASIAGSDEVLKLLLEQRKESNSTAWRQTYSHNNAASGKDTALHLAVQNKKYGAAKLLLEYGANPETKNNLDKKAQDLVNKNDERMQSLFPQNSITKTNEPSQANTISPEVMPGRAPFVLEKLAFIIGTGMLTYFGIKWITQ